MGDAFDGLIKGFIFLLVLMPLGVWKFVEIIIWICRHLHWSVS